MLNELEFAGGDTVYSVTRNGAPKTWAWVEGRRSVEAAYKAYYNKEDFFSVVWQVNLPKRGQDPGPIFTHRVRLQVESPTLKVDSGLNEIKWEVVQAILKSNVLKEIQREGFDYDTKYLRTAEKNVRKNKTTTLFCVVLNDRQSKLTREEKIEMVHESVGWKVDEVVNRFSEKLDKRFSLR
jgi:hypothetical protein